MQGATNQIPANTLILWTATFFGAALAAVVGFMIGSDAITTIVVISSIAGILIWLVIARRRWWLIVPAMTGLGGVFYWGFKVYPHEVALLAAVVPLVMARAMRLPGMLQHRKPGLPVVMYLLSAYLVVHWLASNLYNRMEGTGGFGNVSRAYFNALWAVIFCILFALYGSTRFVPLALLLIYLAAIARVVMTVILFFSNTFAYIPVINYVLPGSALGRATDLRASALALAILAICYFLIKRGFIPRLFHGLIFAGSFAAVFLGAGRGSLVLLCLLPIFVAAIYGRVIPLLLTLLTAGSFILALNLKPEVLDHFSFPVQRASSILLFDKDQAAHYGLAESSDYWHEQLRVVAFRKWTQSWNTFLFGTGIRPFDGLMLDRNPDITQEDLMESSAKVGAYESGWATVIGVTGLTGIVLYLIVLWYLFRRLLPILWKEKVHDHRHAFALYALYGITVWLTLGWAQGGFPSTELVLGFIALFAFQDAKSPVEPAPSVSHHRPERRPSEAPEWVPVTR